MSEPRQVDETDLRVTGDFSRRLNGVRLQLQARARAARTAAAAADADGRSEFAASLRGKAHGYGEAVDLLVLLDRGMPLRRRNRWVKAATDLVNRPLPRRDRNHA